MIAGLMYFTQAMVASQVANGNIQPAPGYPDGSTLTFPQQLYIAGFNQFHAGYACALAVVLFVVAMAFTVVLLAAPPASTSRRHRDDVPLRTSRSPAEGKGLGQREKSLTTARDLATGSRRAMTTTYAPAPPARPAPHHSHRPHAAGPAGGASWSGSPNTPSPSAWPAPSSARSCIIFLTSVMTDGQSLTTSLWPHHWQWSNYRTVFCHRTGRHLAGQHRASMR
ncbi:hypothetical protein ACRAWF_26075 [Streptomyces sp. L7]